MAHAAYISPPLKLRFVQSNGDALVFFFCNSLGLPLGWPSHSLCWPSHSHCIAAMSRHVMKVDGACDKQMQVSNDVADQLKQVRRAFLVWKAMLWNCCIYAYVCLYAISRASSSLFTLRLHPRNLQTESKLRQNSSRTEAISQQLSKLTEEVRHLNFSLITQLQDTEVADAPDAQ